MATLIELVHGLSPELFDNIKDLVFTPTEDTTTIDENYKPSICLQLSAATREQYANRFYAKTTFQFYRKSTLLLYFFSLSPSHHGLIEPVRLMIENPDGPITDEQREIFEYHQLYAQAGCLAMLENMTKASVTSAFVMFCVDVP